MVFLHLFKQKEKHVHSIHQKGEIWYFCGTWWAIENYEDFYFLLISLKVT